MDRIQEISPALADAQPALMAKEDARAAGYAHRLAIAKRFGERVEAGDAVFISGRTVSMGMPYTVSAGERRPIMGFNRWMLLQVMQDRGWSDSRFFTSQQISASGWSLRDNAQPVVLQFVNATDGTGTALAVPEVKRFAVFNAVHVEGVPAYEPAPKLSSKSLEAAMVAADFEPGTEILEALAAWVDTQYRELGGQDGQADQALAQALAMSAVLSEVDWQDAPGTAAQSALQRHVARWSSAEWVRDTVALIEADPSAFFDAVRVSELVASQVLIQTRVAHLELRTETDIQTARQEAVSTTLPQAEQFPEGQAVNEAKMELSQSGLAQTGSDRQAAKGITHSARVEAMFAEREAVLAVPFADKDRAKELGAVWYKPQMVWFVPKGLDVATFKEWDPRDNCLGKTAAEQEVIDSFRAAMKDMDLDVPDDIKADGKWHNVRTFSKKGPNKSGAYLLDLQGGRDGTPIGAINDKYTGESQSWRFDGPLLTPEQRARMRAEAVRRAELADRAVQRAQAVAAEHAAEIVAQGQPAAGHGYVRKKGIAAEGLVQVSGKVLLGYEEFIGENGKSAIREDQNYLIVPMRNAAGEIRAVQAINEDGTVKSFMRGAQKKGTMTVLGAPSLDALCAHAVASPDQAARAALFVEGFATGASVRQPTGLPVIVCFDAGNLEAVAAEASRKWPDNIVPIMAVDNDQFHVERALGYLAKDLGVNPNSQRGSMVEVLSGKYSSRMVSLGDAVADGEWHQAPKGRYCMSLEREHDSTEVRSISIEAVTQEGQRPVRLSFGNRGVEAGRAALDAFAGPAKEGEQEQGTTSRAVMLVPEFKSLQGRPTDWNDLAGSEGAQSVSRQVMSALGIPQQREVRRVVQSPARVVQHTSGAMER
ncbi:DUF5710 domain-containing protein [Cupriavidus nantongensis]|uniref:DUF5710 domain-containing protein n=1 Tax=Cupriavidus nantongensis TaxID=1796606 RepID=A0A142JIZ2_9BURK|nr:DUF5710 domain-containing protein [Cupriavidus nantongensis]AMR78054.1 hypothetical protein A2G96_10030 [Cupriavidus nantongensis]